MTVTQRASDADFRAMERARGRRGRRRQEAFAVLYVNLAHFTEVQAVLGLQRAGEVLAAVEARMRSVAGDQATVARLHRDHYTVLVPSVSGHEEAEAIAQRVLAAVEPPMAVAGVQIALSAYVGAAVGDHGEPSQALLADAELAMLAAEQRGTPGWAVSTRSAEGAAESELRLASDLRLAIERNEFELHYQPIVSLRASRILAFEALIRWRHPVKGLLNAGTFIPLADRIGVTSQIDHWVLPEACRTAASWNDGSDALPVSITVNVTPGEAACSSLVSRVEQALSDAGMPGRNLVLEITEPRQPLEPEPVARVVEQLHKLGVRVALDDFGVHGQSLDLLRNVPIDVLKVDRCFVASLEQRPEERAIVRGLIAIADELGIETVAEGVETMAQLEWLRNAGCGSAQGYLLMPPVDAASVSPQMTLRPAAAA